MLKSLRVLQHNSMIVDFLFLRPLAADGRDGHGPVRGVHRLRAAALAQGLDAPPLGAAPLRRLLGVLLAVRLLDQRHGQGELYHLPTAGLLGHNPLV